MSRAVGSWLLVAAAVCALAWSWAGVAGHARGARAVQGLELWIEALEVEGGAPVVTLATRSLSGLPVGLEDIRLTLSAGGELAGVRARTPLSGEIEGSGITEIAVRLEPTSAFSGTRALGSLAGGCPSDLSATVWLTVRPPGGRETVVLTLSASGRPRP